MNKYFYPEKKNIMIIRPTFEYISKILKGQNISLRLLRNITAESQIVTCLFIGTFLI